MSRSVALAVASFVVAAAACSLTTDFDKFDRGGATPGSSSGTSSSDGAATGAETGASSGATSGGDAGAEGGGGLDCTGVTFCDGFERDQPKGQWTDYSLLKGSTFAITHEHPRSGSSAVRFTLGTSDGATAMLFVNGLPAAKTIDLRYAFWTDKPIKQTNFCGLSFETASEQRALFLVLNNGQATFAEQYQVNGTQKAFQESVPIEVPLGRWVEVAVSFDLTTRALRVVFDGKVMVDSYTVGALPTEAPRLYGGVPYTGAGPSYDIDLDDVRLTIVPR